MAGEALSFDRSDGGRDIEELRRLGQGDHIVLENLTVNRLHAEGHLRLLIDDDQLAVVGRQRREFCIHRSYCSGFSVACVSARIIRKLAVFVQ